MPDQQLQLAIDEIDAILKKHDVAGVAFLQSKTHVEFIYHISPSWSCADISEVGRVTIKAKPVTGPPEEKEKLRLTCGMVVGFMKMGEKMQRDFQVIVEGLGKQVQITSVLRQE